MAVVTGHNGGFGRTHQTEQNFLFLTRDSNESLIAAIHLAAIGINGGQPPPLVSVSPAQASKLTSRIHGWWSATTTMAWQIQITRAKPNPAGKDKSHGYPIPEQLLGEWVDLKNVGDAAVNLSTLHLANAQFGPACQLRKEAQIYWNGPSSVILQPGESVRVHTGREVNAWRMPQEDRNGVHYNSYANRGSFVLNNECGDILSVWWQGQDQQWHREDAASYDPYPPEGQALQRSGDKLVPAYSYASR